jgi:hypothetical protein
MENGLSRRGIGATFRNGLSSAHVPAARANIGAGESTRSGNSDAGQIGKRHSPRLNRDLVRSIYADECRERGKHGALTRTHRQLNKRGVVCVYTTVRFIILEKQDARLRRKTTSRFVLKPLGEKVARLPPIDSAAMTDLRTLYPGTVRQPSADDNVLKSGQHQAKIGGRVLKGKWKGMPIYTLTLEERATCPVSCRHLRSCYGNNMQFARRFAHGEAFEYRLVENVISLAREHPRGFVVRVHVLGDFYSKLYVLLWRAMIETVPQLHVFGYSARHDGDEITDALSSLINDHWDRFAMRFSNCAGGLPATISIELPVQKPPNAIICPAQLGQTESCSTCGLCWHTRKTIAFVQH